MIEFKSVTEKTKMIDPSGNVFEQTIEHRTDPLIGNVASINGFLGEKAKAFLGTADLDMMKELEEKTKATCPFCSVFEKGTKFADDFSKSGQMVKGDTVAVPNLFSKCSFDSVIIINYKNHTLFPKNIDILDFFNAIALASDIIKKVRQDNGSLIYHVLGMNFLNPGGSSVPHPHFQLHIRSLPYSGVERLMTLSKDFYEKKGKNYWSVLCEQEQRSERFINRTGDVTWLSAYAPAHQKEVWGILNGKSSLCEITEKDAKDFAQGISKITSYYEDRGTHPFTLAFFSSPLPGQNYFNLQVRICSRPAFKSLYSNYDTWFAPLFVGDEVHTEAPEYYANKIREFWKV